VCGFLPGVSRLQGAVAACAEGGAEESGLVWLSMAGKVGGMCMIFACVI
jgi:hypothetical protein